MSPSAGTFLFGGPPVELPKLYNVYVFVPFSEARANIARNDPGRSISKDDWTWRCHQLQPLMKLEEVPAALVTEEARLNDDPAYGEPHFRLVEQTEIGIPVDPVAGLHFPDEELPHSDLADAMVEASLGFEAAETVDGNL